MLTVRAERGWRRWGFRFAFAALAIQFALSFGHMHADDVYGPLGHPVVAGHGGPLLAGDHRQVPPGPLLPDDDTSCAICATMALIHALTVPTPEALPAPVPAPAPPWCVARGVAPTAPPFLLFHTRAPPAA